MDETTKVLIGTLSGFLIAFFSEPVKTYWENRIKLKQLRVALYKELIHNYYLFSGLSSATNEIIIIALKYIKSEIRTEFYNQTLNNNSTLFYQLNEANTIMYLNLDLADLKTYLYERGREKWDAPFLKGRINNFEQEVDLDMYFGILDKRLLGKLMSMDENKPIPLKGYELTKKSKTSVPHHKYPQ